MFLSAEEAQLKVGDPVLVAHGPLKGITGRLVRQNKKYFLLKEVPGMGVMVKVSRWCCKPIQT
jgi:ribosomal protein L24